MSQKGQIKVKVNQGEIKVKKSNDLPLCERLILTTSEAALLLGISRQSLYPYIHTGQLKTLKMPGITRIARRDLELFVESMKNTQ